MEHKIVILDGYTENPGDLSWAGFEELGTLTVYDRTPLNDDAEIIRRIGDADIVYTNKTPLRAAVLDACPAIKMIGVLATGYNVVDTAHARKLNIPVCNVPAYGTEAVAQFAIALLLELCCHVGIHNEAVHAGRWASCPDFCFWDKPLTALCGKTMGIIGFGRIGRAVGRVAAAMGMRVLAFSRSRCEEGEKIAEYVDLDTLLAQSDVISLHCPLTEQTQGIIREETIAKMKDGVFIINNGRGPLIVSEDLKAALISGKVAGAGTDVATAEPMRADDPLMTAPNCIITPHISWAAKESRQKLMDIAAENLRSYLEDMPVNVVN